MEKFSIDEGRRVAVGAPEGPWAELDAFLSGHGIKLAPATEHYRAVAYAFAKAQKQVSDAILLRQAGRVIETPKAEPVVIRSALASGAEDTLEGLLDYWKRQGEKRPRTILEATKTVRVFGELVPGLPASKIERRHVVALNDKLLADGGAPATARKKLGCVVALGVC